MFKNLVHLPEDEWGAIAESIDTILYRLRMLEALDEGECALRMLLEEVMFAREIDHVK